MRRFALVVLSVIALLGSLLTAAGSAVADGPPDVTLRNVRPDISVTGHVKFRYHAYDLRKGSRVVLQLWGDHHWVKVARTGKHKGDIHGTFTVAGPGEQGAFRYRAVVTRHGKPVAYSGKRTVHVYATVSLYSLCRGVLDNYCVDGTLTLDDGSTFHSVMATGVNETDDPWSAMIGAAKTSCRSLDLRYISDSQDHTNTYLELRQPGHKKQKHTSSSAAVSTFKAKLYGGKFGISVEQDAAQVFMYFNGSGSCWTPSGKR